MMYNALSKITLLMMLFAFFFTSCSKETVTVEPAQSAAMKAFEIGTYNVVKTNGEMLTFATQQEVLNHFKRTDVYQAIKTNFDLMNAERETILALGLVEKSEDDPAVIEYLKQFETTGLRTGPINFCFHDENRSGKRVWTPRTNPVIRSSNRNKYSSITAIAPQTLCNNKWYGGNHYFYWGTYDKLQGGNDNNAESYY